MIIYFAVEFEKALKMGEKTGVVYFQVMDKEKVSLLVYA